MFPNRATPRTSSLARASTPRVRGINPIHPEPPMSQVAKAAVRATNPRNTTKILNELRKTHLRNQKQTTGDDVTGCFFYDVFYPERQPQAGAGAGALPESGS